MAKVRPLRTSMYVPGNKEDWMRKAPQYGSDALIFDLEDSVPVPDKEEARVLVRKMLEELGYPVSPIAIATLYRNFLDVFVLDNQDVQMRKEIEAMGLKVIVTNTVMNNDQEKIRLANELLEML